jgi:hypothetical protein
MTVSLMFGPLRQRFGSGCQPSTDAMMMVDLGLAPAILILRRLLALCNKFAANASR